MTIYKIQALVNHIRDDIACGLKPYQSSWDALYEAVAQYKKENNQ